MFLLSQFRTLFNYHFHVNERLLAGAEQLTDSELMEDPGYGRGSIHGLLFHVLGVDRDWRVGLETGVRPAPIDMANYQTIEALQAGFQEEKANWESLLARIDDATIQGDIDLTWNERTMAFPYWRILNHLIIHGTQHQSELAHLLTEKGQSPGDLDFIFYEWGNY